MVEHLRIWRDAWDFPTLLQPKGRAPFVPAAPAWGQTRRTYEQGRASFASNGPASICCTDPADRGCHFGQRQGRSHIRATALSSIASLFSRFPPVHLLLTR